jgi:death-on-curing protein
VKSRGPRQLPKDAVLAIHDMILAEHGGKAGLRDERLLDIAITASRSRRLEEDVFQLAASYACALVRKRPFEDGNKRTALVVAGALPAAAISVLKNNPFPVLAEKGHLS